MEMGRELTHVREFVKVRRGRCYGGLYYVMQVATVQAIPSKKQSCRVILRSKQLRFWSSFEHLLWCLTMLLFSRAS